MGREVQFCEMKMFWNSVHNNVNILNVLNCALKNAEDGKSYVMCFYHN